MGRFIGRRSFWMRLMGTFAGFIAVSAIPAHAAIYLHLRVPVNRDSSCSSGYSFFYEGQNPTCFVPKSKKIDLSSVAGTGREASLGGNYKTKHKITVFVVETLKPKGAPGEVVTTGYDAFAIGLGQAMNGAAPISQPIYQPMPEQQSQQASSQNAGQGNNFVEPVPQCAQTKYVNGDLVVVNGCSFPVSITWTSAGDIWGSANLNPYASSDTGQSGRAVAQVGGVHLYACPGLGSAPFNPQNKVNWDIHYFGAYKCLQ